jgi:signal peptidase I
MSTPQMTKKNVADRKNEGGWLKGTVDLLVIVAIALAAKTAVAEPFYVPSASMEPTLLIGDELLAMKYPYGYGTASLPSFIDLPQSAHVLGSLPKRGDVVVFRWPGDTSQIWVKRVIGLPGDKIALKQGRLSINGTLVPLKADGSGQVKTGDGATMPAQRFIETLPGGKSHPIFKMMTSGPLDNMAEITVPPDHIFVMGDNRDDSADSRVPLQQGGVGLLPVNNLVGRVDALVGSWDLTMRDKPVWQWPSGLRLSRFFTAVD